MADLGEQFDPNEIPASEFNGEPLPAGNYNVQISESDVVPTKSGTATMLKLTLDVIDGQFANRKLWVNLNIRHQSEQAQSIAQRALADIFQATGTPPSRESADLHFKPFQVRVVIKQDETYGPKNEVKAYKAITTGAASPPAGKPPVRPAAAAPARPAAPAAKPTGRPWGAKKTEDNIPY